jgi:hypothetical protein
LRRAVADLAIGGAMQHADWEATVQSVAKRELDPITAAGRLRREEKKA